MKRFWNYWKENYEIAKAGKEFAAVIILVLVFIGLGFCRWYGLQNEYVKEWDKYFGYGETTLGIVFTAYALVWLPFRRHEKRESSIAKEANALRAETEKLEQTIKNHDKTEEIRKAKIEVLNIIGAFRVDIGNRRAAIMSMTAIAYHHTLGEDGEDLELNGRWNFINETLRRKMSIAAMSEFASTLDFEKTEIKGLDATEFQTEMRKKRMLTLDTLRHMDRKLQKLMENMERYYTGPHDQSTPITP